LEIWPYLQGMLAGKGLNQEFSLYHQNQAEVDSWNWQEGGLGTIARDDGLYSSQHPIVNYSAAEAGYPFAHNKSIWDMCTGMVSQVFL
jgi:hypothetical protein